MSRLSGKYLNRKWKVGARHPLYREDGKWYHHLKRFPGALFDFNGYIVFRDERGVRSVRAPDAWSRPQRKGQRDIRYSWDTSGWDRRSDLDWLARCAYRRLHNRRSPVRPLLVLSVHRVRQRPSTRPSTRVSAVVPKPPPVLSAVGSTHTPRNGTARKCGHRRRRPPASAPLTTSIDTCRPPSVAGGFPAFLHCDVTSCFLH